MSKLIEDRKLIDFLNLILECTDHQTGAVEIGLQLFGIKRGKNGKGMTWYINASYLGNSGRCYDENSDVRYDVGKDVFEPFCKNMQVKHDSAGNTILLVKESSAYYPYEMKEQLKQIADRRERLNKEFVYFGKWLEKYLNHYLDDYFGEWEIHYDFNIHANPGYQYQLREIE